VNPIGSIRAAFEKRLKTIASPLPIAYENVEFKRPASGTFFEFFLMPATPVDAVMGSEFYFEVGIAQITLIFPGGKGAGPAEGKAQVVRELFPMNLTLVEDGISIIVTGTPAQARGYPDGGDWRVPVSVSWQAQIINP
jgi:hypothetical protein